MHSKRGTLDYLQKIDISDTNICIMCKLNTETNRHAQCFCTHSTIRGTESQCGSSHHNVDQKVWGGLPQWKTQCAHYISRESQAQQTS